MKTVLPINDRILVKRRKVGEKVGKEKLLYAPDATKDTPTDIADVVFIPELTFGDRQILDNAEKIVASMTAKASDGDSDALIALLRLNEFIKIKSIKPGDVVMISKYVGTDFLAEDQGETLTLVKDVDIIGIVREV